LLDTTNAGTSYTLGTQALNTGELAMPGRSAIAVVQTQPGWLLEANGVLHPRGSEYATQYVVDGIPVLENRSPAFAPGEDLDQVQSIRVFTSGIPAEFGRKLGGIVETLSNRNPLHGFHGTALLGGGSFDTETAFLGGNYFDGRNIFGLSASGAHTSRYLDPPVEQNYTNDATTSSLRESFERDLTGQDRLRLVVNHSRVGFLVPNEQVQQATGQRQDRNSLESAGQLSYQHMFSSSLVASLQARVRDLSADLQSNAQSIPIEAFQDRGFRDGYVSGTLAAQIGRHELKFGADAIYSSIHEKFSYHVTQVSGEDFDASTPPNFSFFATGLDREQAFYGQDQIRFHNASLSAGLRFDHYSLRANEVAWSPRIAAAWYLPKAGIVVRGSYDRIFDTPAIENLLLSTSAQVRTLNRTVVQLPVRPARGNYYETGIAKQIGHNASWSTNYFWRDIHNFGDDDTLLNTGISFPIVVDSASIYGIDTQFSLVQHGPWSAWVNYSYLVAKSQLPVIGGLFLGVNAAALLNSHRTIWASQDQRHTAHGELRYQPLPKFWASLRVSYGSGLPSELNGEDISTLVAEFGQAEVDRVNLNTNRIRPSSTLDIAGGIELWKRELRAAQLQADVHNVANRLNVINFASLFSGTAIAPPRTYSLRLKLTF
ncbi:MAG: TonB-dependent receptor, partial [Acidobacteria bacterium]|nr:TonB-dependent receptor [Acidobacteriota bacterium]